MISMEHFEFLLSLLQDGRLWDMDRISEELQKKRKKRKRRKRV